MYIDNFSNVFYNPNGPSELNKLLNNSNIIFTNINVINLHDFYDENKHYNLAYLERCAF